jgi:hypothetical protein
MYCYGSCLVTLTPRERNFPPPTQQSKTRGNIFTMLEIHKHANTTKRHTRKHNKNIEYRTNAGGAPCANEIFIHRSEHGGEQSKTRGIFNHAREREHKYTRTHAATQDARQHATTKRHTYIASILKIIEYRTNAGRCAVRRMKYYSFRSRHQHNGNGGYLAV